MPGPRRTWRPAPTCPAEHPATLARVPLSVQIGLLLAVATALTSIVGFLYKHRGAVESPEVNWRRPVWSSLVLFRSRWYTLGVLIAMAGWGLHVGALSLAPISLVQATIAGGLVLLTVVADRFFAHRVTRREWIGVALAAAGLAFLAATLDGDADSAHSSYDAATLAVFVTVVGTAGLLVTVLGRDAPRAGVLLGAAAGLLWAASDTSIKALSDHLGHEGWTAIVFSPLAAVILAASLIGLLVSARSLQIGPAVSVIAVTSVAANALTIAAGPIVFSEPFPDHALGVAVRVLAFALVIAAAALTPPPLEVEAELP
jgi:drug/metabolite transporter (DMT)-like permease